MLNDKQKRFCEEYIVDLNGTQAAIRAGYSEGAAKEQGSRLLTNANIQEYIQQLQNKRSERTEVTADQVIKELAKIGFSNLQDYIDSGNEVKDLSQLPRDLVASVESIKIIETEWEGKSPGKKVSTTFKLYDKPSALEKLGRHLGIFEADNNQQVGNVIITRKVIAVEKNS